METLTPKDVSAIAESILNMFVGLYGSITPVVATQESDHQSYNAELPRVPLHSLDNIRSEQFVSCFVTIATA